MADGHIEPLSALIRIGGAYGEPWTWAGVLRYSGPSQVVVEGVERAPKAHEWRAAVRVGRESGIKTFEFVRADGGAFQVHVGQTQKEQDVMSTEPRVNLTATITGRAVAASPDPNDAFPFDASIAITLENKNVKQSDLVAVQAKLIEAGLQFSTAINGLAAAKADGK